jgi:hypothetical protein
MVPLSKDLDTTGYACQYNEPQLKRRCESIIGHIPIIDTMAYLHTSITNNSFTVIIALLRQVLSSLNKTKIISLIHRMDKVNIIKEFTL